MIRSAPQSSLLLEDLDHVLACTGEIWETLRAQRIFVTGGTGFFGRWLLESFVHANEQLQLTAKMVVLSRDPAAFRTKAPHLCDNDGMVFVRGDVCRLSPSAVAAHSGVSEFGFVIHAATESGSNLNAENPLAMIDTIVQGTRATLELARATGARRFLLTSSGAIYGRQSPELSHVSEEYNGAPEPTAPGAAYAESKRLAELLCVCFGKKHGIEATIARCFAFVGPFLPLDAHFAIGNFIRDAARGDAIQVKGDGTPYRSYLYAADLMIWLWTILLKGAPGRAYNVGSEAAHSIRSIAEAVAQICGSCDVDVQKAATPGAAAERYVPCTRRAREELRLEQHLDLPEAVRRTFAFVKATSSA